MTKERSSHNPVAGWLATAIYVMPVGDAKEHIPESYDCWCHPTFTDDGILVHNSLDGREKYERDQ